MKSLEFDKIEQKKTKTTLTASFYAREGAEQERAFKRLLAIGIISGGNTNCAKQVLQGGLSKELNFNLFEELKEKMEDLIFDAVQEIERVEKIQGIKTETHNFK